MDQIIQDAWEAYLTQYTDLYEDLWQDTSCDEIFKAGYLAGMKHKLEENT